MSDPDYLQMLISEGNFVVRRHKMKTELLILGFVLVLIVMFSPAIATAIVGYVWFPIKRFVKKRKKERV